MENTDTSTLTLELLFNAETGEGYIPIMGGNDSNPTWEEFLDQFDDDYKPHMELIKSAIQNVDNDLYGITGEQKQNMGVTFKFSDGQHWGFSWRAWGDLMQAIVNKKEGYMKYYM